MRHPDMVLIGLERSGYPRRRAWIVKLRWWLLRRGVHRTNAWVRRATFRLERLVDPHGEHRLRP